MELHGFRHGVNLLGRGHGSSDRAMSPRRRAGETTHQVIGGGGLDADRDEVAVPLDRADDRLRDEVGRVAAAERPTARLRFDSAASDIRVLRAIGVLITPGQMTLTPTPCAAQSARRHCESITTAALDAQ